MGWPAVLVATELEFLDDKMAGHHLVLLGRSTFRRYVHVLLGVAINFFFLRREARASAASSCILDVFLFQPLVRWRLVGRLLWALATRMAGRPLLGLNYNFLVF